MPRYAAFLRGVNLGPHRRIGSADLRAGFEALGFEEVASFRSSGNVVFAAGREPAAKMARRIEKGLEESLGFEVPIYLRTEREVRAIADHVPFPPAQLKASKGKLQVALLTQKPTARSRKEVLALATDEDRLAFGAQEVYWLPSGGTLDSSLDFKAIHEILGATTMRTKGTMEQLAAKYLAG
jgi:uncharacterized protein (DUF1697 family)